MSSSLNKYTKYIHGHCPPNRFLVSFCDDDLFLSYTLLFFGGEASYNGAYRSVEVSVVVREVSKRIAVCMVLAPEDHPEGGILRGGGGGRGKTVIYWTWWLSGRGSSHGEKYPPSPPAGILRVSGGVRMVYCLSWINPLPSRCGLAPLLGDPCKPPPPPTATVAPKSPPGESGLRIFMRSLLPCIALS
jgi:hypothetical protein